ncbi:hypothetical protein ACFXA3_38325 [Streptomyces sp. NPDC059456]|uniref:hypothetical protein n=1 Tax=Streptomyces sp. NPDC059456 TaxID=3346838 RepID=UPI003691D932
MRVLPTAAALLGALALVLPAAGTSFAGDDDGRLRGRLEYIVDHDEYEQIRPANYDTCYELTGTSSGRPATSVRNNTDGRATLYPGRGCSGREERTLEPGDRVNDVSVRSAYFTPVRGRHDDFGDDRRDDWNDDYRNDDDFRAHRTPKGEPEPGREQRQDQKQGQEQGRKQDHKQGRQQGHREEHQGGHHRGGPDALDFIFHRIG